VTDSAWASISLAASLASLLTLAASPGRSYARCKRSCGPPARPGCLPICVTVWPIYTGRGNQAQTVLVALAWGVMFSLTIYLVQHSMLADIARSAPPGMPNVFMLGITDAQKGCRERAAAGQAAVEGNRRLSPTSRCGS